MELIERELAEAKEARERETALKECEMAEAKEAREHELHRLQIQQGMEDQSNVSAKTPKLPEFDERKD